MRPNEYEIDLSDEIAHAAYEGIVKFFKELDDAPEPQPYLKVWQLGIGSREIVWGEPGTVALEGKFQIDLSFRHLRKSVCAEDLKSLFYNPYVNADVAVAIHYAMMYTADVDKNGVTALNKALVEYHMEELYELLCESADMMGWK